MNIAPVKVKEIHHGTDLDAVGNVITAGGRPTVATRIKEIPFSPIESSNKPKINLRRFMLLHPCRRLDR